MIGDSAADWPAGKDPGRKSCRRATAEGALHPLDTGGRWKG